MFFRPRGVDGTGSSLAVGSPTAAEAEDATGLPSAAPLPGEQRERQPVDIGRVAARTRQDAMALHIKLMAIHSGIVAQAPMVAKDAIKFYDRVQRKSDNKQQITGHCLACGKMVTSTASFRLVGHLLKCLPADQEAVERQDLRQARGTKPGY